MKARQQLFYMLFVSILFLSNCAKPIHNEWIQKEKSTWPTISLINEVWYENNQQYIHPSFEYAGSGFLIDTGKEIVAATAKHVLWIAKPKEMTGVNPNPHLDRWVMHPKGNTQDSVLINQLINTDKTETLEGSESSIQERDWILFSTKYVSKNIQPLRPSYRKLQVGETIHFLGCPYQSEDCIIEKATVLSAKGTRIVFSKEDQTSNIGGASGSPIIDSLGYLVGILSGTSVSPIDGSNALLGISTHYLEKVLRGDSDLNKALVSIYDFFNETVEKHGFDKAVQSFEQLLASDDVYFQYSVSPEEINQLAKDQLDKGNVDNALTILQLSLAEHSFFSMTHALVGKAHLAKNEQQLAKKSIEKALSLWPENEFANELLKTVDLQK